MGRAIDLFVTYRFIKLLVTPFNKTEAYKLGIIDERGKVLRKYRTLERIEERQAYTILHRLVFNVKKLIEKVPGGKSRLASYAAALFLIKEHVAEMNDSNGELLEKEFYKYLKDNDLLEEEDNEIKEEIAFGDKLLKGTYKLIQSVGTDEDDDDEFATTIPRQRRRLSLFANYAWRYGVRSRYDAPRRTPERMRCGTC